MPAALTASLDDFLESTVFGFAIKQRLARAQTVPENFGHEQAATVDLVDETLADNEPNRVREARAHLLFFIFGEHADDSIDRLPGVDCVQRTENQMAGFRRGHRDLH